MTDRITNPKRANKLPFPFMGSNIVEEGRGIMEWAGATDDEIANIGHYCDQLVDAWEARTPRFALVDYDPRTPADEDYIEAIYDAILPNLPDYLMIDLTSLLIGPDYNAMDCEELVRDDWGPGLFVNDHGNLTYINANDQEVWNCA